MAGSEKLCILCVRLDFSPEATYKKDKELELFANYRAKIWYFMAPFGFFSSSRRPALQESA
jgi:hypothetical protein